MTLRHGNALLAVCTLLAVSLGLLRDAAADGDFAALTYNVRGLPPTVIEDRTTEIAAIAPLLEDFHTDVDALVAIQELFYQPYFDTITDVLTVSYPFISAKDNGGPSGVGDGLTRMSDFAFSNFDRTQWNMCFGIEDSGNDCLTNKGFSYGRHELEPGVFVDVYNLHADAGQDAGSKAARADNIGQLIDAINANSPPGTAVLVLGDTNSHYTRVDDVIEDVLSDAGMTDVWIQLVNGDVVPGKGSDIDSGCDSITGDPSGPDCELIDKIFYRSGSGVTLTPTVYTVLVDPFGDPNHGGLSDHFAVSAEFHYVPEPGGIAGLVAGCTALAGLARRRRRITHRST